jgi:hypothetical protein
MFEQFDDAPVRRKIVAAVLSTLPFELKPLLLSVKQIRSRRLEQFSSALLGRRVTGTPFELNIFRAWELTPGILWYCEQALRRRGIVEENPILTTLDAARIRFPNVLEFGEIKPFGRRFDHLVVTRQVPAQEALARAFGASHQVWTELSFGTQCERANENRDQIVQLLHAYHQENLAPLRRRLRTVISKTQSFRVSQLSRMLPYAGFDRAKAAAFQLVRAGELQIRLDARISDSTEFTASVGREAHR